MLRKPNPHYLEKLNEVCKGDAENVKEARRLILISTRGLCPAHVMLNPGDGSCLDLADVCQNAAPVLASIKDWIWEKPSSNVAMDAAKMDAAEKSTRLCEYLREPRDIKLVRKSLMRKPMFAIHFFTWEGEPRTKEDIHRAICLYKTNSEKVVKAITTLAKAAGLIMFFAYVFRPLAYQGNANPAQPATRPVIRTRPAIVNKMTKEELLALIQGLCYNTEDPISFDSWQDMSVSQLRTIVRLLDNGGVDFFGQREAPLRVGEQHQRFHCFVLRNIKRWVQTWRRQFGDVRQPKHPVTNAPLTQRQVDTLLQL